MKLLLENGADVNAEEGQYGNALQAALKLQGPVQSSFLATFWQDRDWTGPRCIQNPKNPDWNR